MLYCVLQTLFIVLILREFHQKKINDIKGDHLREELANINQISQMNSKHCNNTDSKSVDEIGKQMDEMHRQEMERRRKITVELERMQR